MVELKEKAINYAEENVINVLKEAFARVYADGYRDGYKDHKDEILPLSQKQNDKEMKEPFKADKDRCPVAQTTDVIIMSCREIKKWDDMHHWVELTLVEDPHLEDVSSERLCIASVDTPQYRFTINLKERYKANPKVLTDNKYDRVKAMDMCNQEFHPWAKVSLECGLYDFTINELTNGRYDWLHNSRGSLFNTYHYADSVHDRKTAKSHCSQLISELLQKGVYSV